MTKSIFSNDVRSDKEHLVIPGEEIKNPAAIISAAVNERAKAMGQAFADEIEKKFVGDFQKPEDQMAHVSTFVVVDGTLYVTYYANTQDPNEDPDKQTARFAFCPVDNPKNLTVYDVQSAGDACSDKKVNRVYDTVLMQRDEDTLFILWTARVEENYYRFYRTFTISTKTLGEVQVNRFQVGEVVNDFSISGIQNALTVNGLGYKTMYSDIGIMQKLSTRMENGKKYYYSGTYSGDFTCIIKSQDLITWEYVAQPDFPNLSKWENATYVVGDWCYYFVRQHDHTKYGFLTRYHLVNGTWDTPVLIEDCQSRGDFIEYRGNLYLVHAPVDREHIGIVKIDQEDIAKTSVVLQAHMHTSCFYPFVQYFDGKELAMSYTIARKHIRLARFTLSKYL